MQAIKNAVAGVKERRELKKEERAGEVPYGTTGTTGTTGGYSTGVTNTGAGGVYPSEYGTTGNVGTGNVAGYETRSTGINDGLGAGNVAGYGTRSAGINDGVGTGNVAAYETRSAGINDGLGTGNVSGIGGGVAPAVERQAGVESGICNTRTFTEVEDRPVIVERVERVLEHHPVEKQFEVITRPVGQREIPSAMPAESLGIRERIVDAAEGKVCPSGPVPSNLI